MENYLDKDFFILFVDDDKTILRGLGEIFSSKYKIKTAESAFEAEKILTKTKIAVIISDQNMPLISGVEFLSKVKNDHPIIRRIMLTGEKDVQTAIQAINDGEVHAFLHKPPEIKELKTKLEYQIQQYLTNYENEIITENARRDAQLYRDTLPQRNSELFNLFKKYKDLDPNTVKNKIGEILQSSFSYISILLETYTLSEVPEDLDRLHRALYEIKSLINSVRCKFIDAMYYLIEANLSLLENELIKSAISYTFAEKAFENILQKNVKSELISYFHDFKLEVNNIDHFNLGRSKLVILDHLRDLLKINIVSRLKLLPPQDMVINHSSASTLAYVLVMKDAILIYKLKISPKKDYEPDLVANFILALTMFAKEIFDEEGHLNTINHDKGVILIHSVDTDLHYIVLSDKESIHHTIGLVEFANQTKDYFLSIQDGLTAEASKLDELKEKVEECLINY